MPYSIHVCAVSCSSDRYVWITEGTEEEVIAQMADDQGRTADYIRDNYEIEEESVDIPYDIQRKIIEDSK